MSDTDRGNLAPGGRESPVGELAARGRAAGAEEAVVHDAGPPGDGDEAAGAGGDGRAVGSPGEAAGAGGVPEGSVVEEDSDIGPADEGEENAEQGPEVAVDAYQLPMVGFRFMFLNLVRTLLHRLYYNDHVLVRPRGTGRMVWPRHQRPRRAAQIRVLLVPEASGEGGAAAGPEGSREGAPAPEEPEGQAEAQEQSAAGETEEAAEEELVLEAEGPEGEDWAERRGGRGVRRPHGGRATAGALAGPAHSLAHSLTHSETTKYQHENSEEEAQDAESNEEQEEFNKKQEGPKKDEESAESRSGKSKCLCVALKITQPFLAFTCS
ncbi:cancer/testis antigen 47A-like [Molossus molossus]|uniref:cancer/testis antigen 47A-like n=1 Tax=Molossus molossus TaxID=27622 RepID=UPI001747A8DC|nr:cancer/testis antigen 47A-like [Molossus molossus]